MPAEYHIRTNGFFWRPDAKGYTADIAEAGRFSMEDVKRLTDGLGPEKKAGVILAQPEPTKGAR